MQEGKHIDDNIQEMKEHIILIGNPGGGKSTILNGLVKFPKFKAGFNPGEGMTTNLQIYEHTDGIVYGDTPGLSDIKMREKAAKEITKALQMNGKFKLIFVVTVESGRIRPDDVATINLVLDSINHPVNYGVIVNKVSEKFIKRMKKNKNNDIEKLYSGFNSGKNKTNHFFYLIRDEEWNDQDDIVPELPEQLKKFIYETLPPVVIMKKNVKKIETDQLESMKRFFELEINRLYNSAEESKKFYEKTIEDLNVQNKKIIEQQKTQMDQMNLEHQKLYKKIEKERKQSQIKLEQQNKFFEEKMRQSSEMQNQQFKQQQREFHQRMMFEERLRKQNEDNMIQQMRMMQQAQQQQPVVIREGNDDCVIL